MPKKLILNADDYGWDKDANEGILHLIQADKIHNVSILANHCSSENIKALQLYTPVISCGLHVCLNEGAPLIPSPSSSILNDKGLFYTSAELFKRAVSGKINYADVFREINAQYNYLKDHGLEISHADSHQHIHQYPFLSAMITKALYEIGIGKVRSCKPYSTYDLRRLVVHTFCLSTARNISAFKHPDILITDFTNKNFNFTIDTKKIIQQLSHSNYQTIEWMCHPALKNKESSYLQRKNEYDFLMQCDWEYLLKSTNIELSQYRFL